MSTQVKLSDGTPVWGDEGCITAQGVELVEDLQEIQQLYSRRSLHREPLTSVHSESLGIWGYDLSQRLNAGELTVENVVSEFRASLDGQDSLAFMQVGPYSLCLERGDATSTWSAVVHTDGVPATSR